MTEQPDPENPTESSPTESSGNEVPPAEAFATATPAETAGEFVTPALAEDTASLADHPSVADGPKKRRAGMVTAALLAAVVVGGISGGGVTALVLGNQGSATLVPTDSGGPQSITINDNASVNLISAIAAKATPSVVTISVDSSNRGGTGSGVIISEDGYVLTNTHVVTLDGSAGDAAITVETADGAMYSATVVGTDPVVDLAVIKLEGASGLTPMTFADSRKLNVGETTVAIGAPLGLENTVTTGIISALNRSITIASSAAPKSTDGSGDPGKLPDNLFEFDFPGSGGQGTRSSETISLPVIQTDAAINPGNSGGALLNGAGELIGINVAIASTGAGSETAGNIGVGFSIPANLAERVAGEIIKNGSASHGLLGANVGDSTTRVAGAYVDAVTPGGAADSGGLQKGDVITEFNGVRVGSASDLTAQVRYLAGGADGELNYVRGGKTFTVSVTLGTLGE